MPQQRVAVVTGANRGIGFEICRQLAKAGLTVVLTSRDKAKGRAAARQLEEQGLRVHACPLDVTSDESVRTLMQCLLKELGRCDILVNNAGVFLEKGNPAAVDSAVDTLRQTMETNVYGPFRMCQAVIPLMKQNRYGRIINISSGLGQLAFMEGGNPGYRMSKTTLNAVTRIFANETQGSNILVNSMCPGWVKTDMGGPNAERSVEQGADTAVWLATLPDNGPTGKFFRDRREIPW